MSRNKRITPDRYLAPDPRQRCRRWCNCHTPTCVLDSALHVLGITWLRVCDAHDDDILTKSEPVDIDVMSDEEYARVTNPTDPDSCDCDHAGLAIVYHRGFCALRQAER